MTSTRYEEANIAAFVRDIVGIQHAIKGMRLSHDSEHASDTWYNPANGAVSVGVKDMHLLQGLLKKGDDHSAALRMIHVYIDVKMPLHFWKQMDKYKVGVECRSRSTMHTLMKRPLDVRDFDVHTPAICIDIVNSCIDQGDFKGAIAALPCGYIQERLMDVSIPALRRMFLQRTGHKNHAWEKFLNDIISSLRTKGPLGYDIIALLTV